MSQDQKTDWKLLEETQRPSCKRSVWTRIRFRFSLQPNFPLIHTKWRRFIQSKCLRVKNNFDVPTIDQHVVPFLKPVVFQLRVQQSLTPAGIKWRVLTPLAQILNRFLQKFGTRPLVPRENLTNLQFYVGNLKIKSSPSTFSNPDRKNRCKHQRRSM